MSEHNITGASPFQKSFVPKSPKKKEKKKKNHGRKTHVVALHLHVTLSAGLFCISRHFYSPWVPGSKRNNKFNLLTWQWCMVPEKNTFQRLSLKSLLPAHCPPPPTPVSPHALYNKQRPEALSGGPRSRGRVMPDAMGAKPLAETGTS